MSIFKFASLYLIHFVLLFNCEYADLYLRNRFSALHSWFVYDKELEREGEWVPTDDPIRTSLGGSAHSPSH